MTDASKRLMVLGNLQNATYLYSTPEQLCKKLQHFCKRPQLVRQHVTQVNISTFSWETLEDEFKSLLRADGDMISTEQHTS